MSATQAMKAGPRKGSRRTRRPRVGSPRKMVCAACTVGRSAGCAPWITEGSSVGRGEEISAINGFLSCFCFGKRGCQFLHLDGEHQNLPSQCWPKERFGRIFSLSNL